MKYIKIFDVYNANVQREFDDMNIDELLTKAAEKGWLNKNECTIRDDGFVDVGGNVDMCRSLLTEIPIKFGYVSGNFSVFDNKLNNLRGVPSYVGGDFYCSKNELTTLDGGPEYVGGIYDCDKNLLISLDGIPDTMSVLKCTHNQIINTIGFPQNVLWMAFWDNKFPDVEYLNTNITRFRIIIKYQEEYGIWNTDGTLNKARYDILVSDHQNNIID